MKESVVQLYLQNWIGNTCAIMMCIHVSLELSHLSGWLDELYMYKLLACSFAFLNGFVVGLLESALVLRVLSRL